MHLCCNCQFICVKVCGQPRYLYCPQNWGTLCSSRVCKRAIEHTSSTDPHQQRSKASFENQTTDIALPTLYTVMTYTQLVNWTFKIKASIIPAGTFQKSHKYMSSHWKLKIILTYKALHDKLSFYPLSLYFNSTSWRHSWYSAIWPCISC